MEIDYEKLLDTLNAEIRNMTMNRIDVMLRLYPGIVSRVRDGGSYKYNIGENDGRDSMDR